MVQTVSIYNNPLLATSTSSQPSQPVWKLPKKPRKKRRPKIQINPNVGLQSDQQVNPILTDKPVNPPECFTEINAALNSTEPRTEEILLEHQNSTKYTTESDSLFNATLPQANSDIQVNLTEQERDLPANMADEQKDKLVLDNQVLLNHDEEEEVHFKVQDSDFMSVQVRISFITSGKTNHVRTVTIRISE